ncbi:hypothetical protein [Providencia sp.]|uniref:hypothetical protein n=1 Tax=Providencia sp. TaxID=589 RepID=UPI000E7F0853|nr:hypothetical protein [Providencia sp.]MBP6080152.1 hypothetical protein [Providencia sp.]HBO23143.1 hypothetical protein [Providencia sp.]
MSNNRRAKHPIIIAGGGLLIIACSFPAQSTQVSARIKAVTCVMSLSLDSRGTDISWNVGITTRPNNTVSVAGSAGILKRKVVLGFSDPGFVQIDPITGKNFDCTKATGGMRFLFEAKDKPDVGDFRAGTIPDVNTGARYFEYFVTYNASELKAATGGVSTTLALPFSAGQFRGEDVMPLTGNPLTDALKLNFTGGEGTLGKYPFYVWLVNDYQNPVTAPTIQTPINKYTSSITITATYL